MFLIGSLCVLLFLILGGSYYAYRIAFFSPKKGREKLPSTSGPQYDRYRDSMGVLFRSLKEREFEFVTITSQDGLVLSGRYYHVKDGAPLDIAFHGYRSSAMTDFSGGASLSLAMGHDLLLVDQRSHGKSQGRSIAFGIQERWDALCWVNYAIERFGPDVKILLFGISMGAATVLMASELALPENVKGIVADCPYSSPKEILCKVGKEQGYPVWLMWPFLKLGAKIYGSFDICESSAAEAVRNTQVPILLIHGEADAFVPCDMSRAIQQANPGKIQLVTIPNAGHGLSYLEDETAYSQAVRAFIEKLL